MSGSFWTSAAVGRVKSRALGSTALSALTILAAHGAYAQTPPANSLPGAFSSNQAVTYMGTSSTAATIATVAGNNVLQWGGTALLNPITPSGKAFTTNPGFSIGSGATLTINGGATSVLATDLTGSRSQIFGKLDGSALGGPLFVSNTNGVIVGATGNITAPTTGVGLLGYAVDATAFGNTGTVTVNNSTMGTGGVTTTAGAMFTNGPLLVASNGTVNIGALAPSTQFNIVVAGYGFSAGPTNVLPTVATALTNGGSSVVNFTPAVANGTLTVDQLNAAGTVNNSANLALFADVPGAVADSVLGLFTNSGVLADKSAAGDFAANQLAGGLSNTGVINQTTANLDIQSAGNISSKGVLNLMAGGGLTVYGANVDVEGAVQIGGKALNNTTNSLAAVDLETVGKGKFNASQPQTGGWLIWQPRSSPVPATL